MKKGQDIAVQFSGLQLIHHNCPGLERRSLSFKEHLVFIPLQGELQIELKEKKFSLGPGKMLYLPPQSTHSFASSIHQGERLIVLISPMLWKSKSLKSFSAAPLPLSLFIKELLFYLLLYPKTKHASSLIGVLAETLSEHLEMANSNHHEQSMEHLESRIKDFRVMAALEFMRSNIPNHVSMNHVAKKSGLSLRSLNRLVLEQTGFSPRQILIQYRISKAQELFLSGKHSVTHIAAEVGYHSLSQFIAAFRNITGQLPSEFARMASFQKQ